MDMDRKCDKKQDEEHILVCLSPSPSNEKIIYTAAKMAEAFKASFTALYVQNQESMSKEDENRLKEHIQLAEQLHATVVTVYGQDISYQIAEFARLSHVTKIVIGRNNAKRRHFWSKPTLNERLIELAWNMDIHIIPDFNLESKYGDKRPVFAKQFIPSIKDILLTLLILFSATLVGTLFLELGFAESNIITVYLLGVLLISLFTKDYTCSVAGSVLSVMFFNFFLTEPRLTFHAYNSGYPITFLIMLVVSVITGTLASKLKVHAKKSAQSAFGTKVLLDTNQLLQQAQDDDELIHATASQLMKLLNRNVIAYPEENGKISKGYLFSMDEIEKEVFFSEEEKNTAEWVFKNKKRAGATTEVLSSARCLYLAIRINKQVFGVIGIDMKGQNLDSFENSVLLSILGECALAIENNRNRKEKELADIQAKNEKLRANLLRTISHDLRTPLTSISGNARNLLINGDELDDETKMRMYEDIFDDSNWLISLVENLLSVTRLEEGRINFHMSCQLIEEVIEEALLHINRNRVYHKIFVDYKDEMMMAQMDVKLIMQVLINLVDNAIKYTPKGSEIKITVWKNEDDLCVSVADNGKGILDEMKEKVFEMFFTGNNKIADSHRSLGLGLPLCKSIINAHKGEMTLKDNLPHGCIFTFTLPREEVKINE